MEIVTYQSVNAPVGKEWIAYLVVGGEYMPVRFSGATEDEVCDLATAEWSKHEAERERAIAAREEGRRKAAETKARKKGDEK